MRRPVSWTSRYCAVHCLLPYDAIIASASSFARGIPILLRGDEARLIRLHTVLKLSMRILHRLLPSSDRNIDILMIGNFNHTIHAGRARFLARVSRLSAR